MVGGTYYVVTGGHYDRERHLDRPAYALGPTAVLFGKHTDKLEADRAKGIRTLPVLLGERARATCRDRDARRPAASPVGLVARGALGWPLLVVLFAAADPAPDRRRVRRAAARRPARPSFPSSHLADLPGRLRVPLQPRASACCSCSACSLIVR